MCKHERGGAAVGDEGGRATVWVSFEQDGFWAAAGWGAKVRKKSLTMVHLSDTTLDQLDLGPFLGVTPPTGHHHRWDESPFYRHR